MTDKQIIFGVDVSKCPYAEPAYGSPKCRINGYVHCDGFRNCEYKQLKRKKQRIVELNKTIKAKEQECEELKDKLNCCFCNPYVELNDIEKQRKCVEVTECFRRQLDQLKAENQTYKKMLEDEEVILALNEVRTGERHLWFNKAEKLKLTLTEIKEVAQYDVYTSRTDLCLKLNLVKKKISECEGNDEH